MLLPNTYTLQFTSLGMCDDLLEDAGYDPDVHADVAKAMALAADLAAVDTAYEVMREHGLKPLADQENLPPAPESGVNPEFAAFKKEMAEMVMDTREVPEDQRQMWRDLR